MQFLKANRCKFENAEIPVKVLKFFQTPTKRILSFSVNCDGHACFAGSCRPWTWNAKVDTFRCARDAH